MRTSRIFFAALSLSLAAVTIPLRAAPADSVAVQYHFAGADQLSGDINFQTASRIFHYPSTVNFEGLVLTRLARIFWTKLQFDPAGQPGPVLGPILDDLLRVESIASFDATGDNFVLAARMDKKRAEAWRQKLETAMRGKGSAMSGLSGWRWNNGCWMIETPDWVLVGKGDRLASVRTDYLEKIQKTSHPASPFTKDQWFEAYIDGPRLSAANSPHLLPLKPARATVSISAKSGRFHVTADLSYPQPAFWTPTPWRIPKELVHEPLISFTAAQNVAPYMQLNDTFSRLPNDPFTNQFFCWAQHEMPFQAYMAWPVADGAKVLGELAGQGISILNPFLQGWDHTRLKWSPRNSEINWNKSQLMGPFLRSVSEKEGNYLLAGLFYLYNNQPPAPANLWQQFEGHSDIVYYNWELTGPRVHQWRLYSEIDPQMLPVSGRPDAGLNVVESWLAGLELALGNTVTEVTRTSPQTLTLTRSAPFVFTGLELAWLSHWLSGEPAGPVNMNLLPKAKVTGPGIPSH
jgi:hypothetical protein